MRRPIENEDLTPLAEMLKGETPPERRMPSGRTDRFMELLEELIDARRAQSPDWRERYECALELLPGALEQLIDGRVQTALKEQEAGP